MEFYYFVGYFLAILVGITLGLVGSGGSILSVPILVYIMGIEPILATAYSLFIVGTTALVGGFQKAKDKLVDFKKVFLFGLPTVLAVFFTRIYLLPSIPKLIVLTPTLYFNKSVLIMVVFALVMLFASVSMIKKQKHFVDVSNAKLNYPALIIQGLLIGLIAGFVGAGGGFLIIPALLLIAKTPMKMAVGTSLLIIALQSLVGFLGDLHTNPTIDWKLLGIFTSLSIVGFFIGNYISKKVEGERLKTGFGFFILFMAIVIIVKEIILT